MIVIADSSILIHLATIGRFYLLNQIIVERLCKGEPQFTLAVWVYSIVPYLTHQCFYFVGAWLVHAQYQGDLKGRPYKKIIEESLDLGKRVHEEVE